MNARIFVAFLLAISPTMVYAQEMPIPEAANSWFMGLVTSLMSNIPLQTIAWIMAAFAAINALSKGLAKLVEMTATTKDDEILAKVNKVLSFVQKCLDFVTANTR
jgi:hypothetical protein